MPREYAGRIFLPTHVEWDGHGSERSNIAQNASEVNKDLPEMGKGEGHGFPVMGW